ncbi:hypothetical protein OJAV_G00070880 [Oryzias javanicus]|uniref:Ig-like domain-containing protein n=1 Tax=Oryzias javanicus TaxID=123683 RepID=A0A437D8R8_ORYJA|nr:hypothetical protein OJAV_G00070880 [Oryzias javanicus]
MFDFTSLLFPLILTWMLTFTDAQTFREETVRVGDEVTLKCENANDFSDGCSRIIWIYSYSTKSTIYLFENGKILTDFGSKTDRLSVTENCSLVIEKITDEDAGIYTCRQFSTSGRLEREFWVDLNVTNRIVITSTRKTPKTTIKPSAATDQVSKTGVWGRIIYVLVGVAALSAITVSVYIWSRTRGAE